MAPSLSATLLRASRGRPCHAGRCPCCRCRTPHERAGFEICPACFREDDGQDDGDADKMRGGPNRELSLGDARRNYRQAGAADPRDLPHVRPPTKEPGE